MAYRIPIRHYCLVVGGALAVVGAPGCHATSLADAMALAYVDNPRLAAARAQLRAVDETVAEAKSGSRPLVTGEGGYRVSRVETNEGSQDLMTSSQALSVDQVVYSGGRVGAEIVLAETNVMAQRARSLVIEQEILFDVVTVYASVLRERTLLELAIDNETRLRRQLDAAIDRYRFGEVTRTDVAQAETRHARAVAERERIEGTVGIAISRYGEIVGQEPEDLEPLDRLPVVETTRSAIEEQIEEHPALTAARHEVDVSEAAIELARSSLRPRLSVNGRVGYTDEPDTLFNWQSELGIGASLVIPLYQGGGEYARVRRSKQLRNEARLEEANVRRSIAREHESASRELLSARSRIASIETQREAALLALEGVRSEALLGLRTVLDILDAEEELFEADRALALARYEEQVAAYAVIRARGGLTARALELPVEVHDPLEHYDDVRNRWFGLGEPD